MEAVGTALRKLRDNYEVTDFTLVAEIGKEFPVHKVVLFLHSDVLYRMSTAKEFVECQSGRLNLKEVDEVAISTMVDYFYNPDVTIVPFGPKFRGQPGDCDSVKTHTRFLIDLWRLADTYNIGDLREWAEQDFGDFFMHKANIEHIGMVLDALAELHAPSMAWKKVLYELTGALDDVHCFEPIKVMEVLKRHPSLAMDVLHDFLKRG